MRSCVSNCSMSSFMILWLLVVDDGQAEEVPGDVPQDEALDAFGIEEPVRLGASSMVVPRAPSSSRGCSQMRRWPSKMRSRSFVSCKDRLRSKSRIGTEYRLLCRFT